MQITLFTCLFGFYLITVPWGNSLKSKIQNPMNKHQACTQSLWNSSSLMFTFRFLLLYIYLTHWCSSFFFFSSQRAMLKYPVHIRRCVYLCMDASTNLFKSTWFPWLTDTFRLNWCLAESWELNESSSATSHSDWLSKHDGTYR